MKLRSLVLVACMLVVPALAMFSHLIPAEIRAATRRSFTAATSGLLGTPAEAGVVHSSPGRNAGPGPQAVSRASAAKPGEQPPEATTTNTPPVTPLGPQPHPAEDGAPATKANLLPVRAQQDVPVEPATPALVAQLADRTRQIRDQQAREQQRFEAQLTGLGAVSIDCQPVPGPDGLYSSSCRVPVDATGQLQRVFQAVGHDPGSASAALLEQVTAWRQRVASQPPPATGATADAADPMPVPRMR